MTADEARELIRDTRSPILRRLEAVQTLLESPDTTIDDLVQCLRCRGVIASSAATGLFARTGRPRPPKLRDQADVDQWEQYLIKRRLTDGTADTA
jgi:hypothetical protein